MITVGADLRVHPLRAMNRADTQVRPYDVDEAGGGPPLRSPISYCPSSTAPAPTASVGAVTSPFTSASGPISTGPWLSTVPFTFPRTISPPHLIESVMALPFFSTVTTPHVATCRRASYCLMVMSSSLSGLLQNLQVMLIARRATSCGLAQYRQTIVCRSSGGRG